MGSERLRIYGRGKNFSDFLFEGQRYDEILIKLGGLRGGRGWNLELIQWKAASLSCSAKWILEYKRSITYGNSSPFYARSVRTAQ
jgi:hypothetical protein